MSPRNRQGIWVVSSGMSERRRSEPSLIDGLITDLGGPKTRDLLARLDASVDWERLAAPIRQLPEYASTGAGRPAWPAAMMLRCLMLAKWFNLSDPQLEETLQDRLSFRRFAGLSLTDKTPDETTFVRFRARLRESGLHDVIFKGVVGQREEQGLLVRQGSLVDATIIEQARGRKRPDGVSTRDGDASFTAKHGRTYFGYKGHISSDRSGIVTEYRYTTARPHDGRVLDEMTMAETHSVVADSMYDSGPRRANLRARGVTPWISYQRRRGQAELAAWQRALNAEIARMRAIVEHPFAMIKQQFGHRRARYRGLERNRADFGILLAAANIKRSLCLRKTG